MHALYSLLLLLVVPLALILRGGLRDLRWRERLGRVPPPKRQIEVWVHATSFGEVQAATPLVDALLQRHGDGRIGLTTTTVTGSDLVRSRWGERVAHAYLPFDLPCAVAGFLDRWRPRRAVILESELWPNLFRALRARGVPLLIANARMSPRSRRRYAYVSRLMRATLSCVDAVAAQAPHDADSYRALGAGRVEIVGNLKFDCVPPPEQLDSGRMLREALGADRPVWVAASTHDGEEQAALQALRLLLQVEPRAALILVPRHPQRFDAVWERLTASGLRCARRSAQPARLDEVQVLLGDSMGEMFHFLAGADVAFVGGSLVSVGGHNLLEPAALGLPVLSGPQLHNQRPARDLLLQAGGARLVEDATQLGAALTALFGDPRQRQAMGVKAREALAAHQGATERTLRLLDAIPP